MEFAQIIIPVLSGAFAFGGAIIGNRTDIAWIKKELVRHDGEIREIREMTKR